MTIHVFFGHSNVPVLRLLNKCNMHMITLMLSVIGSSGRARIGVSLENPSVKHSVGYELLPSLPGETYPSLIESQVKPQNTIFGWSMCKISNSGCICILHIQYHQLPVS